MTAPGQQVIPVPGLNIEQAIAPFVHAMQFQQQQQRQQQAEEQRIAAELFARGLQTPGFETSPAGLQLAVKLGVPDLGQSIAKARGAAQAQKITDINQFVESASGLSDKAKAGLRVSLVASVHGATSEVQNSLFSAIASGEDPGILENARLQNIYAQTAHLQALIEKMKREPGPQDQLKAAQILNVDIGDLAKGGQNPGDFVTGMNYINVLEDQMKQRETDPAKVIFNAAVSHMSSVRDIFGNPTLTPERSFADVLRTARAAFPKTAGQITLTPEMNQALAAEHDAMQVWNGIKGNGDVYQTRDGKIIKFKNPREIRAFVEQGMKALYPLTTDDQRQTLLDVIQRRIYTSASP